MTEITRVPLQPIAKGSLAKIWIGIVVIALFAAGIAWATVPQGIKLETVTAGQGDLPAEGQVMFVKYTGRLADGTEFDKSKPLPLPPGVLPDGNPFLLEPGQAIDGFYEGLLQMRKGGKYVLNIPASMAYGASPPPSSPIPANADLIFDVEVIDVLSREEVEQRVQVAQQMMMGGGESSEGEGNEGEGEALAPPPTLPGQ